MNQFDELYVNVLEEGVSKSIASGLLGLSLLGTSPQTLAKSNTGPSIQDNSHIKTLPRGIRNNNPGNIEFKQTKDQWQGTIGSDGRFIKFKSAPYGIRAIGKLIRNYGTKYNLYTIEDIIKRWAPEHENDTEAYIKSVVIKTGVPRNQRLNLYDKDQLKQVIAAIIAHENANFTYPNSIMDAGIDMLF